MMRRLLILIFALGSLSATAKAEKRNEAFYQKMAAEALKGEMEVVMPDGSRCDILTEEYAIEVEKAANWKESIGQSLNYAFQSNRKAGVILIVNNATDSLRLMSVIQHYQLPITVWTVDSVDLSFERISKAKD